jgi:hypothetical protein
MPVTSELMRSMTRELFRLQMAVAWGILLATGLASPGVAHGQGWWLGAGGGRAVPLGDQVHVRTSGWSIAFGAGTLSDSAWGVRADAEYFRLGPGEFQRAMRGVGLSASAALFFGNETIRPYMLAGLGGYRLQIDGAHDNPYGTTVAVSLGVGLDLRLHRRLGAFAETRYVLHATDYGLGGAGTTSHGPVHVGVRWSHLSGS